MYINENLQKQFSIQVTIVSERGYNARIFKDNTGWIFGIETADGRWVGDSMLCSSWPEAMQRGFEYMKSQGLVKDPCITAIMAHDVAAISSTP